MRVPQIWYPPSNGMPDVQRPVIMRRIETHPASMKTKKPRKHTWGTIAAGACYQAPWQKERMGEVTAENSEGNTNHTECPESFDIYEHNEDPN